MKRPIGVTILAALSFLAGLANLWRVGVYMGWFKFDIVGTVACSFRTRTGRRTVGAAHRGHLVLGRRRTSGTCARRRWQFGAFISLFTLIWGFFALLFGSTVQYETIPMLLALIVYVYLNGQASGRPSHRRRCIA